MSDTLGNGLSRPPYNPGLRDLVQGKRKWAGKSPSELGRLGFAGWHERGYLPHRDEPGLTQFVTFRLCDSFPRCLRSEWEHLYQIEDDRQRKKALEDYLDKGKGSAWLKRPEVAGIVEDALRIFHGERYELRAWVVMPNHVHVLLKTTGASMGLIIASWKKYTALKINNLLGRSGRFWQQDYWDTYMRDAGHELKTRRYIENNPARAGLEKGGLSWLWSSARFRDDYMRLTI